MASAFPGFLGSQGDRGGGQVQGKKQVEASSFGHCGMFSGSVPALRSSDFCGWGGASAAEGGAQWPEAPLPSATQERF